VNYGDGTVCCYTTIKFNMEINETPDQPTEQQATKKKVPAAGKDQFLMALR
jgi:hypothetical protein